MLDLIYHGPLATYKNAQAAINQEGEDCGTSPSNVHVTVVLADSPEDAVAECQAGPDPAADAVTNLASAGFVGFDEDVWFCSSPLSDALLVPGSCTPIGGISVLYNGPRDTLDNVEVYTTATDCTGEVGFTNTYVQHGSQPAALALCQAISPAFNQTVSLSGLPAFPNDAYLCNTTA